MSGTMDCHGQSDRGLVRESNEDQFLIAGLNRSMQVHQTSLHLDDQTRLFGPSEGRLLLVADGMGGHAAGKRASTVAVDSLAEYVLNSMPWFLRLHEEREGDFREYLRAALSHCQHAVEAEAERVPARRGMGTTLTMGYLAWPRLYVVHVGDSRCYLLRGGRLQQLTRDHTVARRLVEEGVLPEAQAESSRWSHVLWNVVGGNSHELDPEVYKTVLARGDSLLLCTDGLTAHVGDDEIARTLGRPLPAAESCRLLVEAARAGGGSDNITVVVAHFRDTAPQEAKEARHAAAAGIPAAAPVTTADAVPA
jgi:protein phosphatase